MRLFATCLLSTLLASAAVGAPAVLKDKRSIVERDGKTYNVFEHAATGAKLEFVHNSGICETTPGVNQYSGYVSVGQNMNMWFWFFEARNNPKSAPLAAWFNGGPGCSSMIALFQENGPCHFVNGEKTPSLNEYSWNNDVNMVYIDQPIGVGFSYGNDQVSSTDTAAPYVWKFIQAFYAQFPEYESRDFGIFTESYGGHYGPGFASFIQEQNAAIKAGSVGGEPIELVALGINNGWYDSIIQQKAYIEFSYNNKYRQILNEQQRDNFTNAYNEKCLPALKQCPESGQDRACVNAVQTCNAEVEGPIMMGSDFNIYDIRHSSNDPYPPKTYQSYLQKPDVLNAIGARQRYSECSLQAGDYFDRTGDNARTFLPDLSKVVQSGISVLVWAGDADWICNWVGSFGVANAVSFSGKEGFQGMDLKPYTVNGKQKGTFKAKDNFSFLRVFEAGHEVPYYQPETSLQAFMQTMSRRSLSST